MSTCAPQCSTFSDTRARRTWLWATSSCPGLPCSSSRCGEKNRPMRSLASSTFCERTKGKVSSNCVCAAMVIVGLGGGIRKSNLNQLFEHLPYSHRQLRKRSRDREQQNYNPTTTNTIIPEDYCKTDPGLPASSYAHIQPVPNCGQLLVEPIQVHSNFRRIGYQQQGAKGCRTASICVPYSNRLDRRVLSPPRAPSPAAYQPIGYAGCSWPFAIAP